MCNMGNEVFLSAENILFTVSMIGYFITMILFFVFFAMKNEKAGSTAAYLLSACFGVHTVALVVRTIGAGRLPLTNNYEFATSFAWGIALVSLIFIFKYQFKALGAFSVPVIFLVIGYAAMQSKEVKELMPALRSSWLFFHVSTAIIAYGGFGVSFAVSLMFLLREKMNGSDFWNQHIPDCEWLDMVSYRAASLGLLFLTFTIITGSIWAERAWGSYWSWDPKETWSLVTWLIYMFYLHLRIRRGVKGRSAAIFAAVGFICVIFTYIGVNTFLPGVHSYA